MTKSDEARAEIQLLRQELQELKRCQLQYFTLSVTGAAAILGFAGSMSNRGFLGPSLLAPLAIIIPCWWIFFDKATTITRIVGYIRLLESVIADHPDPNLVYPGFEEALSIYRRLEDDIREGRAKRLQPTKPERRQSWLHLLTLRTRHRYWMANLYTFILLAALCCVAGWGLFGGLGSPARSGHDGVSSAVRAWSVGIASMVTVGSTFYGFHVVYQLVFGKYSYVTNEEFWRYALDRKRLDQERLGPANSAASADQKSPLSGR